MKYKENCKGFTLIEMTIVLLIASVIMAAVLSFARPYFAQMRIDRTNDAVRATEIALRGYFNENGVYPCPAPLDALRGTAEDGTPSNCADPADPLLGPGLTRVAGPNGGFVRIGAIPYRELNIPADATIDSEDNRLTYAVVEGATSLPLPVVGEIDVVDTGGVSILSELAFYMFFSHGLDGKGSYTDAGVANGIGCAGPAEDIENCDGDAIFVAAQRSLGTPADYYDDVSPYNYLVSDSEEYLWARTPNNSDDIYNLNTHFVGIGTDQPWADLTVRGKAGEDVARIAVETENENQWARVSARTVSDNRHPVFIGVRGRGTPAAPAFAQDGDVLVDYRGWGWGVDPGSNGAGMRVVAAENFAVNRMGSDVIFRSVPNGTISGRDTLVIREDGRIVASADSAATGLNPIRPNPGRAEVSEFSFYGTPGQVASLSLQSENQHGLITATTYANAMQSNFIGYRGRSGGGFAQLNDKIVTFQGRGAGVQDNPQISGAGMRVFAAEDFGATKMGSYLTLDTVPLGATMLEERLRITEDGRLGIGKKDPDAKLEIYKDLQDGRPNLKLSGNGDNSTSYLEIYEPGNHGFERGIHMVLDADGDVDDDGVNTGTADDLFLHLQGCTDPTQDTCSTGVKDQFIFWTDGEAYMRGPVTVEEELQVGNSGLACGAKTRGSMRYNSAGNGSMEFCSEIGWMPMGASGEVEFYDCYQSTQIASAGIKCNANDELVKEIISNGGDWGGNDYAVCCKARLN